MYHTGTHPTETTQHQSITMKLAGSEHAAELRRVAERDSAGVPEGELLVALVGGEMRAAISVSSGRTIADPFHRTADLVVLLRERVAQLRGQRGWRTTGSRFAATSSKRLTGVT